MSEYLLNFEGTVIQRNGLKNFVERNLFLGEKEFQWNVIGSKDHGQVSKHLVVISNKSGRSLFQKCVQQLSIMFSLQKIILSHRIV